MTSDTARRILQFMLDGVDPMTGEILPPDHLCNYPDVTEAIRHALNALPEPQSAVPDKFIRKNGKLNAGRPWTKADLNELSRLYRAGTPMPAICLKLQRRERGVKKQLEYLGLTQNTRSHSPEPSAGPARAGLPWTMDEDDALVEYFEQRLPLGEIAAKMQRTEYAIYCRMELMDLYGSAPGYPRNP